VICSLHAIRTHKKYPAKLNEAALLDYSFVRETEENLYCQNNLDINDFIRKVIPSNTSKTDIFEYSVYLYGYYNKRHLGLRNRNHCFPLFLKADKLYSQSISLDDELFVLSFEHIPEDRNYWHFQLYTVDSDNNRIPRNTRRSKDKNLAKHIFRRFLKNAICQESEVITFQCQNFDKVLRPLYYCFCKKY